MNGNILIKNAAELVTCSGFQAKQGRDMDDLHIIEDGAVLVEDGIITAVGTTGSVLAGLDERALKRRGAEIFDAVHKSVLPGFVDCHTHFVFGGYRAEEFCRRLRGESYMDILHQGGGILSTVAATEKATRQELVASGLRRLDSMLCFGVTTAEGKSGYGLDRDTEIKQLEAMQELSAIHPVEVVRTFLGAHAVPPRYKGKEDAFIDFLIDDVLPEVAGRELAEFCDVFCEHNVFSIEQSRRLLFSGRSMGLKVKVHADEMTRLGGAELAAALGAVSADHLLHASNTGIRDLAAAGVVAVLLPATAFILKEPFARARYMIDQGCAVALATDLNPGSGFTESIPLLAALAVLYMGMTPEETITALTINAAAAIDRAAAIGSIDTGKAGDLVVLEFPSYRYIPYHVGVNAVEKVIKKGNLVYDALKGGIVSCSRI